MFPRYTRRPEAQIASVADAEFFARRRLPKSLAQAIEHGEPSSTFARNLEELGAVRLRPRAAVDYPTRDVGTTVLGHQIGLPVIVAPTGNIRIFHPDGEVGAARAVGAARTIVCVSSFTGHPIETVVAATTAPVFYQLYFLGGRASAESMIERARAAGCAALVVTVDSAAPPQARRHVRKRAFMPSEVDFRSGLRFLPQVLTKPRWLSGFVRDGMPMTVPMAVHADGLPVSIGEALAVLTTEVPVWEDIGWIRDLWRGPIVIKGLLSTEDARRAVDEGASAIVVSNHGGHMLPDAVPGARVLPAIAEAVGNETEVLFDTGIRSGADVVKAIALGARAVLIGRGYLWAHAAAGERGVARILEVFRSDIDDTLRLIGCPSISGLSGSFICGPEGPLHP